MTRGTKPKQPKGEQQQVFHRIPGTESEKATPGQWAIIAREGNQNSRDLSIIDEYAFRAPI
jgi:hypothetical protein